MVDVHERCRLCGNTTLVPVLNLGEQPLSSVFPAPGAPDPSRSPLELVRCDGEDVCGLLQLRHSADVGEMYGATYGYRSGTTPLMREHLGYFSGPSFPSSGIRINRTCPSRTCEPLRTSIGPGVTTPACGSRSRTRGSARSAS